MWHPLTRLASCRNLVRYTLNPRSNFFSSLAQFTCSDVSDSSSDENNTNLFCHPLEKLDTFKVTETLHKLSREPTAALLFITQLKVFGFKHDVVTYIAIVRFLCHWGMDGRLYNLFVDVIESNNGELSFEIADLSEALIEEIKMEGSEKLIKAIDVLVKVYAKAGRFEEAIDTLYMIKRGGLLLSTRSCNYLMNQLIEWGKLDMLESVYRQLKKKGLIPNVYTYVIVIKGLCRKGCLEEAWDVFTQMREAGVEPNAFTFGTFIDGLCSNGKTDEAFQRLKSWRKLNHPVNLFAYTSIIRGFVKEVKLQDAEDVLLDMMNHTDIIPDADCYCLLIRGYCQKRNIRRALDLHHEMQSKRIKTNCVIVSLILQCLCELGSFAEAVDCFKDLMESGVFLDEVAFNIAIDASCKLGEMDEAMELLEKMKDRKMKPDVVHYTTLINGYGLNLELQNAFEIFEDMKGNDLKPDTITYNVLAGWFSRCGLFEQTIGILHDMRTQDLEHTSVTHNVVIKELCKGGKVKEARDYFNSLEGKNLDNYAAMMSGYCEANRTKKALKLLLSNKELLAKRASCLKLLSCLCAEGETRKALALFQELESSDNGACKMMYAELISLYLRVENMKMARRVFDKMIQKGLTPDVVTYTMMLNGYCRVNCLKEACCLFNDMKNRGIEPDIITYTVLLRGGRKEDVPNIVNEIKEMGLNPDVYFYTAMIDKHCRSGNLLDAVCLFNKMKDRGPQPNTVTYNALLRGYCSNKGYREKAEALVEEMISKGIQPNKHTMRILGTVKPKESAI